MTFDRLIAVGLAMALSSAVAGSTGARDTSQDERFILRAESAICDAIEASDGDSLRNALDEHYTQTDSSGIVMNRDQVVSAVARRDPVYLTFRKHGQKVRLYGDAAVVTGITTSQGHTGSGSTFAGDDAYTETWVHVDGRWKLAASHSSLLRTR